jgi:hypothetical protein
MAEVPPADRQREDAEHEAKRIRDTTIARKCENLTDTPSANTASPPLVIAGDRVSRPIR